MKNIVLLSLLGALGVLLRHLLENKLAQKGHFLPLGTLTANLIGCFLAGLLYQFIAQKTSHQELASITLVGFCGGLTTFSGYALTSLNNLQNGEFSKAALYLVLSPLAGLVFAFLGMKVFKLIA